MTPVFDFHARLAPRPSALDRLYEVMDRCRIDRAAVAAGGTIGLLRLSRQLVTGEYVDSDADNNNVLAACAASGGRLIPVYFANPHRPVAEYRKRAAEFRGLEISPAVHGVSLADEPVIELVAAAADAGHSVYLVCLSRAGCQVANLVALARRFPDVTFVLGHCGIGNIDYYAVELIAPQPNVMLETSGGYTTVLSAALERLGASRVLFGTEYPLQHPLVELAKYQALGLPEATWQQVAWGNAERLFFGLLLLEHYSFWSTASTSSMSRIFSETRYPPPSSTTFQFMPKSVRLISPVAEHPSRVPP
jgi:predicted TIM-barrel fold metal-dependent hydrolase